jgi:hypothetical protein
MTARTLFSKRLQKETRLVRLKLPSLPRIRRCGAGSTLARIDAKLSQGYVPDAVQHETTQR